MRYESNTEARPQRTFVIGYIQRLVVFRNPMEKNYWDVLSSKMSISELYFLKVLNKALWIWYGIKFGNTELNRWL